MDIINPIPTGVELKQVSKQLSITWQDGSETLVEFEQLRANCACSSCRSSRLKDMPIPFEGVTVSGANSMGSSGIQFEFSDGHSRGIFPWGYIKAIGDGRAEAYLETRQAIAC